MSRYLIAYAVMETDIHGNYNVIHNDIVEWDGLTEYNITKYMFEDESKPKRIINIIKLDLEKAWK